MVTFPGHSSDFLDNREAENDDYWRSHAYASAQRTYQYAGNKTRYAIADLYGLDADIDDAFVLAANSCPDGSSCPSGTHCIQHGPSSFSCEKSGKSSSSPKSISLSSPPTSGPAPPPPPQSTSQPNYSPAPGSKCNKDCEAVVLTLDPRTWGEKTQCYADKIAGGCGGGPAGGIIDNLNNLGNNIGKGVTDALKQFGSTTDKNFWMLPVVLLGGLAIVTFGSKKKMF